MLLIITLIAGSIAYKTSDLFFIIHSKDERFGLKYNEERLKRGIPPIPVSWYTKNTSVIPTGSRGLGFRTNRNYWASQVWSDFEESHKAVAYHKEKELRSSVNDIDSETDRFVMKENDSIEYMLELKYSYLYSPDSAWSSSIIKTTDTKDDYLVDAKDITKKQADSVLLAWGIDR